MTIQKEFGRRLEAARKACELSMGQVATRVGLSLSFYGRVERGQKLVSLRKFARLHRELGFDGNVLIDGLVVEVYPIPGERRHHKVTWGARESGRGRAGFGRMLAAARGLVGLTQKQVAVAIGCTRRQVTAFEGGRALPRLRRFARLWRVLGFDVDVLLTVLRGDEPPREPFYGFGQVLAGARLASALSRSQVARAAGCATGEYLAIERGQILPTMAAVVRIHSVVRFDANAAIGWVWESGAIARMS